MKRVLFFGMAALLLITGLVVVAGGLAVLYNETAKSYCQGNSGGSITSSPASLTATGLTVKDIPISTLQRKNAAVIIQVAFENGLTERDAVIALMTAIQEAALVNIPYGYPGSSSVGLFQQIAAWGPYNARMDPYKSSYMFYFGGRAGQRGLTDIPGRDRMSLGDVAQAVQQSGFPDAYDQHQAEAEKLVAAYTGKPVMQAVSISATDCPSDDPIEQAVLAALSRQGDRYNWKDASGAGLVSWAYAQAGIPLPDDLTGLTGYAGDSSRGVKAKLLHASDVPSSETLQRGDIVLWSSDGDDEADNVGIELGAGGGGEITVATYNVLGSNHTGIRSADQRIGTTADLVQDFDVIGLQELQADQRDALLRLTDGNYSIYPAEPMYGEDRVSVNSIVWDNRRFDLVTARLTPMPYYYGARKTSIPLIKLRDRSSGQEFYVVNTHDPAGPSTARLRYLNGLAHAELMDGLDSQGLPMFFTGDFNSGYGLRSNNNVTYQNERQNLTWCLMTRSGTMVDAYDAERQRSGTCPLQTTRERGVGPVDHVFVSRNVSVTKYGLIARRSTGSDHPIVYAKALLASDSTAEGSADSKWQSFAIGRQSEQVDVTKFDTRHIVAVIRVKVTTPIVLAGSGTWTGPMRKGTYTPSSTSGGNYGWRIHPVRGTRDFHNGIDLAAATGTPVYSIGAGRVLKAYYDDCWGNLVIVDHGEYVSMYDHLSSFASGLKEGQAVDSGQHIGNVGNTGACSAGAHLHFTVGTSLDVLRGEEAGSVDPVVFMRERGIVL